MRFSKENKKRVSIQLYLNPSGITHHRSNHRYNNLSPPNHLFQQKQNYIVSPNQISNHSLQKNKVHVQSLNISKKNIEITNTKQNQNHLQFSKNLKNKLKIKHQRTQSNRLQFYEVTNINKNEQMSNFSNSLQNISKEVIEIPFARRVILPKKSNNQLINYQKTTKPLQFRKNNSNSKRNSIEKHFISPDNKLQKNQSNIIFKNPLSQIPKPKKIENYKEIPKLTDFILKPIKITESGSILYLALHKKLKMIFAIKSIRKGLLKNRISEFLRQIKIGYLLCNTNIVQIYGFFADENNFYLIRQYLDEEFIDNDQQRLTEGSISLTISQVLIGIKQLVDKIHYFLITHKNLSKTHGVPKITNFKIFQIQKAKKHQQINSFKHLISFILQNDQNHHIKDKGLQTTDSILFMSNRRPTKDFTQFKHLVQNLNTLTKQNIEKIWNHPFLTKYRMNSILKD